jgi:diguanylate cyclase (GGDEF)-like protein/PAS domain S-box-containing protein
MGMAFAIISTAERHTARKNKQHAKVFEISHDGVMITNADNDIISVNAAFTSITGYTTEEVIGKNPRILSSGRQSREFYADMWKALIEVGHWQGEVWNRRKDGSAYLERLIIHTITDANGSVINRIGNFSDITLQKSTEVAIAHQAQHDFLTDLPNRLLFCDRFNQQLAFSTRHSTKFAVIYLDLDKFKPVNDSLGHQVGDQLLIAVAERLSELVREIDTVSRFGGDEFAILVSEVDTIDDVITLANKVIDALAQPFILEKHTIHVSASLGIALYPDHGTNMETLMNEADAAMYQAKRNGHNNYVIAAN